MTTTQLKTIQADKPTVAAAAVAGGGTFTAGAKYWKVTTVGSFGESAPSDEATATTALNGHADLTFTGLPSGSNRIRVWRGPTGAEDRLIATLEGTPATWTDSGGTGTAGTPPAAAAWGNMTKTGIIPAKANVPAGTRTGLGLELIAAMASWCAAGGTGPQAALAQKRAKAAGFQFQEV